MLPESGLLYIGLLEKFNYKFVFIEYLKNLVGDIYEGESCNIMPRVDKNLSLF